MEGLHSPFRFVCDDEQCVAVQPEDTPEVVRHRPSRALELILAAGWPGGTVLADRLRYTDWDEEYIVLIVIEENGHWGALAGRALMHAADGMLLPGAVEAAHASRSLPDAAAAVATANRLIADLPQSRSRRPHDRRPFERQELIDAFGRARARGWMQLMHQPAGPPQSLRALLAGRGSHA